MRLQNIASAAICGALCAVAPAQTTFDHNRWNGIAGASPLSTTDATTGFTLTGGELLTEGPTVGITPQQIGLVAGDDISGLSFGDDIEISGFHVPVFSVQVPANLFAFSFGAINFERTVGTAPSLPGPGASPPEAAGDLFIPIPNGFGSCDTVLAPAGFGYAAGTLNGDEANAGWMSPNFPSGDDLDAFDYSPPTAASANGIFFTLAPGSPTLGVNGWSAGDILWSPLSGQPGSIQRAQLAGFGAATASNLNMGPYSITALNCVAAPPPAAPGTIAAGAVGPTPCSPGGGTHLLEFSTDTFTNFAVGSLPPALIQVDPSDILGFTTSGYQGLPHTIVLTGGGQLGLCTVNNCAGLSDGLTALEVVRLPSLGSTFDHDHGSALTIVGQAGDLLTEGFPGPPNAGLPMAYIGLQPGDEIDAVSYGDEVGIAGFHTIIFSVDVASVGRPGSGVEFESTFAPAAPEAHGDLFEQSVPPGAGGPGNTLAPAGFGYNAGTGTGDESNATWVTGAPAGASDDLDAFDYSPAATGLTNGLYFSLAAGSPSLAQNGWTAGDILYSTLQGPGSITAATLAPAFGNPAMPATDVNLGIAGFDLDALNLVRGIASGTIAQGAIGPTPGSGGGQTTHLIEFSVDRTTVPPAIGPGDVLGVFAPGTAGVLTSGTVLGLCTAPPLFCATGPDNLDALEDPSVGCGGPHDDDDLDGLTHLEEVVLGTDPCDPDTDGDGIPDGEDACPLEPGADDGPVQVCAGQWSEQFDSYVEGPLPPQSAWEPWSGNPDVGNFLVTAEQSRSAPHSLAIDASDDAVRLFSGFDDGAWTISVWVYVPQEMDDLQYFILLNSYPASFGEDWSLALQIDGAVDQVADYETPNALPLVRDAWSEIRVTFNLDEDTQTVYYNGQHLVTKVWADAVEPGGVTSFAAVDLWGNGSSHTLYYDDFSLVPGVVPPPCSGDSDGNGAIDVDDLVNVILDWGTDGSNNGGDVDGSGIVDVDDLVLLILLWGNCY